MEKKIIYDVKWEIVDEFDEDGYPSSTAPFVDSLKIGNVEYPTELLTTNLFKAIDYYETICEIVRDTSYDVGGDYVSICKREVLMDEEKWKSLEKKDEIDYGDIAHAKTVSNIEMVSYFKTEKESDYIGDYYEEMLFVQSKYFNMKAICEKAGICYSTYRGFKNNHQYFSTEKKLTLLRCMYDVGTNCMSKEMKND